MAEENKTTTQGDSGFVPPQAQNKFESSKTHVRKAAEDLRSAAGVMAGDLKSAAGAMAEEYRGKAEQAWEEAVLAEGWRRGAESAAEQAALGQTPQPETAKAGAD